MITSFIKWTEYKLQYFDCRSDFERVLKISERKTRKKLCELQCNPMVAFRRLNAKNGKNHTQKNA